MAITICANRYATRNDIYRAEEAALAVFAAASVKPSDAYRAYQQQWAEFDDEAPMTGLAQTWIAARDAAEIALTEGWHDTNGGYITEMYA